MSRKFLAIAFVAGVLIFAIGLYIRLSAPSNKGFPLNELSLEPRGRETLVIAGIPQMNLPEKKVFKSSWKEVEEALPEFKEVGVNEIFIWTPYEAIWPEKGRTMPVRTEKGMENLEIKNSFVVKNYLKPDPERGNEEDFLHMIEAAHSLGLKVVAQLQITVTAPGSFVYDEHPDWMLKSVYGEPAIFWPWEITQYGYVVNKANPELIKYVTDTVIPLWVKKWNLDGIYLDSVTMAYCNSYIKNICDKVGYAKGYECSTPVDGYYSPESLVEAMRLKIDELEAETGKPISFVAEMTQKSSQDGPDSIIAKVCRGNISGWWSDPGADRTLGKYFDWVQGYNFRGMLKRVSMGDDYSYSSNYVKGLKFMQGDLDEKYVETTKFVNMWVEADKFFDLLKPDVAGAYIVLDATAPGNIVWIGEYQIILKEEISKGIGYKPEILKKQYEKLITIKKAFPALQSDNIEDALLSPKVPKLIAYNRWEGNESATVIVNINDKSAEATVKTRFEGQNVTVYDVLSGEKFAGNSANFNISIPAYGSRILTIKK